MYIHPFSFHVSELLFLGGTGIAESTIVNTYPRVLHRREK